mgnify:FL=1
MNKFQSTFLKLFIPLAILLYFTQCNDIKDIMTKRFLMIEVEKINKDCPKQLSPEIRLDSCKVADRITLKTYATMIHVDANFYDAEAFKKMTEPGLIFTVQTSEDLKKAKDYGVTFTYVYHDAKGELLAEIVITPDDYNKPIDKNSVGIIGSFDENEIGEMLEQLANNMKSVLPMQIDEITTLSDIELEANNTLAYTYIVNMERKDINENFAQNMQTSLTEQAKFNPEIKKILNAKAILKYTYIDKNNVTLCEITLTKESLE